MLLLFFFFVTAVKNNEPKPAWCFIFRFLSLISATRLSTAVQCWPIFLCWNQFPIAKLCRILTAPWFLVAFAFEHGPHTMLEPSSERIFTSSSFLTESSHQSFFLFTDGDGLVSSALLRFDLFLSNISHCVVNGPMQPMAITERAARRLFRSFSDSKIRPKQLNIQH